MGGRPHARSRETRAHPDVRIVFRHFPLRHLHAHAELLSRIAEAAHEQDRFWELHDELMASGRRFDLDDVRRQASDAGLELGAFDDALRDEAIAQRVQRDVASGQAAGVHSTPSFFFDGMLHDGRYDERTLEARLAEARARAGG